MTASDRRGMRARRRGAAAIGALLGVSALLAAGAAGASSERQVEDSLDGVPFNVLLPPDYATSDAHYPVLYLLHGFDQDHNAWIDITDVESFTADKSVIVVIPSHGKRGWYTDWRDGSQAWETFQFEAMIPYVEAKYRAIPDRAYRAVAGLSMGGFGAMSWAARHPDAFVVAGAFSGIVDTTDRSPFWEVTSSAGIFLIELMRPEDGPNLFGMWGDPATDAVHWHNQNPTDLAPNFGGISLYIASGNGVPSEPDEELENSLWWTEPITLDMSQNFSAALEAAGVPHVTDFYGNGIHTARYWERDLHVFWPQMEAAFGSAPPDSFDYRTADASFSVWGWTFAADPLRAAEFLDVEDASAEGLTLRGSGVTAVETAPYFHPLQCVVVSDGEATLRIPADLEGRLSFDVDLGPAHALKQYTAAQAAAEALAGSGYWTTRAISLTAEPKSCGAIL